MSKCYVLLGALVSAAWPSSANAALPAGSPTLVELEVSMAAELGSGASPGASLSPLRDDNGNVEVLESSDGAYGGAYYDTQGNTIIAYQFSERSSQSDVAAATLSGDDPASLPAYKDALAFADQVALLTITQGRSLNHLYVTGFSEGGMLASFVAWQTGAPGVSFASCGMPGYSAPLAPANNFVSFLESGDPIGQYATDSIERKSAIVARSSMDHYGIVVQLESAGNDMESFAAAIAGHSLLQVQDGSLHLTPSQTDAFYNAESNLMLRYHQITLYSKDANDFAASDGY